jgi:hypothetical protein
VAVGTGRAGPVLVERLEGAGEEEHRDVLQRRVGLQRLAQLVAVLPRHDDVGEDDVGLDGAGLRERVLAVVHRRDLVVLGGERDAHDLLDRDGVIRE